MPALRMIGALSSLVILCACAGSSTKPDATAMASPDHRDAGCLSDTGGHIPTSAAGCSAYGRTYTSADIERTGSTTAAGALRILDPAITVHQY